MDVMWFEALTFNMQRGAVCNLDSGSSNEPFKLEIVDNLTLT